MKPSSRGIVLPKPFKGQGLYAPMAVGLLYLAWYLVHAPHHPVLTRDSATYIDYDPIRTVGYPLVLRLLPLAVVTWVQPVVFAAALVFYGSTVARLTGSAILATAAMLLACAYPDVSRFHGEIMTESLVMSLAMVLVALAARLCLTPTLPVALGVSTVAGGLTLLRPSCVILVPVAALLAPLALSARVRGTLQPSRLLLALLAPMLILLAVDRVCDAALHGARATSLAGRHAFAKAALLHAPPGAFRAGSDEARLSQALDSDFTPLRAAIASAPRGEVRRLVQEAYENCLAWRCAAPARAVVAGPEAQVNRWALKVALDRIRRRPLEFLALEISDDVALWRPGAIDAPHTASAYNRFTSSHRPLPFEAAWPLLVQPAKASKLALGRELAVSVLGVATLVLVVGWAIALAARRRLSPEIASAVFAALCAQAIIGFSAVAAPPDHRFTTALWPILIFSVVLAAHALTRWARQGRRSRRSAATAIAGPDFAQPA